MNIAYYILMVAAIISAIYIVVSNGIKVYRYFKPEYDEYVVDKLTIIIYYNRDEQNVVADFKNYEDQKQVIVRIYSTKEPTEEEKKNEGIEVYNDKAVVRCAKGTYDVIAWYYLDQKYE